MKLFVLCAISFVVVWRMRERTSLLIVNLMPLRRILNSECDCAAISCQYITQWKGAYGGGGYTLANWVKRVIAHHDFV